MKITAFILLVCTLHVSAGGYSQSITLSEKEAPLDKVFKSIEKQTDYIFFYNVDWISKSNKVNVEVKNMQLQQVLDLLFKNQPLSYSITGKMITVFPKKNDELSKNESALPLPIDIHGKVVDENGKPVPSVTVTVKGTKKQTITNESGEFNISDVSDNGVLVFSSVNMEAFEISVSGKKEILAKLKTKTSELDEVQIIAYGQTTKRFQTGNVWTVKGEDIQKQPVGNPLLAIEGRVPGVFITQNTGVAGGSVTVRIQGQNSIGAGLDPLIVVDGVPYPSQLSYTFLDGTLLGENGGSPLSFLNPGDIESIDVLKDADATAIYGSRAANGAILITTKKGSAGKMKIDINVQQGWGKVARKMDMLNTRQYLDMRYEAFKNDNIDWMDPSFTANDLKVWDTTKYSDWQKILIGGTSKYSNVNASLSGGTANMNYLVSGTWHRETSVFPGNFNDEKGSLHFNLNTSSSNQKLKFQLSGNYLIDNNRLPGTDLTSYAIWMEPNAPDLYKPDGTLNWATNSAGRSTWTNPLVYTLYRDYSNVTKNLVGNAMVSYSILPGLDIKSSFGYTNLISNIYSPVPLEVNRPESRPFAQRYAYYGDRNMGSWIIEPQLTYKKDLYDGTLEVLVGTTFQETKNNVRSLQGSGYSSDQLLKDISSATSITSLTSGSSQYKYNAIFSRINYNWKDKYILNLTGRRDGSSRFGPKNMFNNFGSVGAGWIFSQESFIQKHHSILSFGKIRASYGTTGNDQIADYTYLSLYGATYAGVPYQNSAGLSVGSISNPYLQWEETRKLQLGLELGFFSDRILINGTYSRNRSSNLLLPYSLPTVTGFDGVTENFPAEIQNSSWEFMLNTSNVKSKNFKWTSSINLTIPKNELLDFPNLTTSSYAKVLFIGQPVNVIRAYHFLGVDPKTGEYQVADSHGSPTTNPDPTTDMTVQISTAPKFYGGFQNALSYKGFHVDFLFQFVKQKGFNYIYSNGNSLIPGQFIARNSNQPEAVVNRWRSQGDVATIARYNSDGSMSSFYNVLSSDAVYLDASFIRLKNLSISWEFPRNWKERVHFDNCRIFAQGQNLLTITKYKGMDPENQTVFSLPPLRVITVGLQVGL